MAYFFLFIVFPGAILRPSGNRTQHKDKAQAQAQAQNQSEGVTVILHG
jgi:hypothetical protein